MSTNPMELLKKKVSSELIHEQDNLSNEKSALLSKFYPIFLSILMAKPEFIQRLKEIIMPSLSDLLGHNERIKTALLANILTAKLTPFEAEQIINKAIPKCLTILTNEAGNESSSILNYLKNHKDSIQSLLPLWAISLLAPVGLILNPSNLYAESNHSSVNFERKIGIFPIIGFLTLGLLIVWLWQSCHHQQLEVPIDDLDASVAQ
ncbi:hypothetical protein [Acinetobacter venetianus]|uniref:Uncharacterized protein n=1 Tax=Acinetobacter venetianus TaxID=52133 RepID=A0A150HU69_9GAMM|nr:hypothetical protein [Acinetobacter venetianus]KXZ70111.1 hypothetical protein AVENLUH13518_02093 [Acinetobacter venetianus]